jgi:uncharacterized protein (TIGR02246 family)
MIFGSSQTNDNANTGALGAIHAWMNAVNRNDLDAIVAAFANDASFFGTTSQTLVSSRDGIREYFDTVLKRYAPLSVELGSVIVSELSLDSAIVTGYDQWSITIDGKPAEGTGRLSLAVALREGRWQIVSFHRSAMPI